MKSSSDWLAVALVVSVGAAACDKAHPDHASAAPDNAGCAKCHVPEFTNTSRPPHPGARPTACGVCHLQTSWHPFRLDHPGWQLTGAHERAAMDRNVAGNENQVKCFWCHRGDPESFKGTPKACVACHEEEATAVRFPHHDEFGTKCDDCHSTEAWKPAKHPEAPQAKEAVDSGAGPASPTAKPTKVAPTAKPRPTATATATATATPATPATATTTTTTKPDVTTHASPRRH